MKLILPVAAFVIVAMYVAMNKFMGVTGLVLTHLILGGMGFIISLVLLSIPRSFDARTRLLRTLHSWNLPKSAALAVCIILGGLYFWVLAYAIVFEHDARKKMTP